jgi:hypothetical protein
MMSSKPTWCIKRVALGQHIYRDDALRCMGILSVMKRVQKELEGIFSVSEQTVFKQAPTETQTCSV